MCVYVCVCVCVCERERERETEREREQPVCQVLHWHLTPASSACVQPLVDPLGQARRLASVPVHTRLSNKMGPEPSPKNAYLKALANPLTWRG